MKAGSTVVCAALDGPRDGHRPVAVACSGEARPLPSARRRAAGDAAR